MNKGISAATCQWLYFMGADDYLAEQNVLTKIFEYATECDCDIIYSNVIEERSGYKYAALNLSDILSKGIHHQSIFYKYGVFAHTGKYDLKYKIAADIT